MDTKTAEILRTINNSFYQSVYPSFSNTRTHPWPGWAACLPFIEKSIQPSGQLVSVFDLACGNLRFEEYLAAAFPEQAIAFYAVDDCEGIVSGLSCAKSQDLEKTQVLSDQASTDVSWNMKPNSCSVQFQNLDVLKILHQGLSLSDRLSAPLCDLSVSFGFLHHVPMSEHREEVIRSLIRQTRSGGLVIVTFWQFVKNEVMREFKTLATTIDPNIQEYYIPDSEMIKRVART